MSEKVVTFIQYNRLVDDNKLNTLESLKSKLIEFSVSNKNVFEIEKSLGDGNLIFLKNIIRLLQDSGKSDAQLSGVICDCLRICFRQKNYFTSGIDKTLFNEILLVGERNVRGTGSSCSNQSIKISQSKIGIIDYSESFYLSEFEEIVQLSLRCLMNILNKDGVNSNKNDQISESDIFTSEPVNGLLRLFNIMASILRTIVISFISLGSSEEFLKKNSNKFENVYFSIRLLYMLVSQRPNIVKSIDNHQGFVYLIKFHYLLSQLSLQTLTYPHCTNSVLKTYIENSKLLYSLQIYSYPFTVLDNNSNSNSNSRNESKSNDKYNNNSNNNNNKKDFKESKTESKTESKCIDYEESGKSQLDTNFISLSVRSNRSEHDGNNESIKNVNIANEWLSVLEDETATNTTDQCIRLLNKSIFSVISKPPTHKVSTRGPGGESATTNNNNLKLLQKYSMQIASMAFNQIPSIFKEWCADFVSSQCVEPCLESLEEILDTLEVIDASDARRTISSDTSTHYVSDINIDKRPVRYSEDEVTALLAPLLVVLINVATNNSQGRIQMEDLVFPHNSVTRNNPIPQDELAPRDAPIGTLRYKLIKYMTDSNLTIKRFVSELLYELCNQDSELFIERTGFGNACALLQGKGILDSVKQQAMMGRK